MDMETRAMIGSRIASARKVAKLTQTDLAKSCGVHAQTVSKWERGVLSPNGDELVSISKATGSSPNFLLGFSDTLVYRDY